MHAVAPGFDMRRQCCRSALWELGNSGSMPAATHPRKPGMSSLRRSAYVSLSFMKGFIPSGSSVYLLTSMRPAPPDAVL